MTRPLPPRLLDIDDGVYVAGTHDIHTALQIAVDEHPTFEDYKRDDDPTLTEEDLRALRDEIADRLFTMIEDARPSTFRKAHAMRGFCPCGEGHDWDLVPARPGTRGAMKVVWWG